MKEALGHTEFHRWLDTNQDGVITVSELGGRIERKKKEYGISDVLGDPVQLQIEKNQRDREKFKNRPDLFFGTNISQGQKADNLQLASSMTEESMDGPMVALQVVYVKSDNFVVSNNSSKSSRGSANNFSEQYRMAVLEHKMAKSYTSTTRGDLTTSIASKIVDLMMAAGAGGAAKGSSGEGKLRKIWS